ncbi:MAG: NTPase [Candidatus Cloacimonetes bacterium]|nr:NTPase [Candidatus Cloacimonadota bacterium]MBL7108131.1 NTPase [Candidatus Cloacimonadota bacterium]
MLNNILISGYPGCGKTTLINKIIKRLNCKIGGFYTHEKREFGKRTGFYITDFSGNQMIMAEVNLKSKYHVGKYGVNVNAFEKIGIPALKNADENTDLIVIDEIGKMEMFSPKFCNMLEKIFDSHKPILATIKEKDCKLTAKLKARDDVKIFHITTQNRDESVKIIFDKLSEIMDFSL